MTIGLYDTFANLQGCHIIREALYRFFAGFLKMYLGGGEKVHNEWYAHQYGWKYFLVLTDCDR